MRGKTQIESLVLTVFLLFIISCTTIEKKRNPDRPEDLQRKLASIRLPANLYRFSKRGWRRQLT